MAAFHFELVAPERLIFAGDVEAVVVPGTEGEFTVLKDHAPLMSTLKPGVLEIEQSAAQKAKLFVRGGFAEVSAGGLIVLAEQAIALDELNAAELDAALRDAEEDIADAPTDEARRIATEKRDHLQELRAALQI
jgi:F-type H+-transporting ATPase subunit epsilon